MSVSPNGIGILPLSAFDSGNFPYELDNKINSLAKRIGVKAEYFGDYLYSKVFDVPSMLHNRKTRSDALKLFDSPRNDAFKMIDDHMLDENNLRKYFIRSQGNGTSTNVKSRGSSIAKYAIIAGLAFGGGYLAHNILTTSSNPEVVYTDNPISYKALKDGVDYGYPVFPFNRDPNFDETNPAEIYSRDQGIHVCDSSDINRTLYHRLAHVNLWSTMASSGETNFAGLDTRKEAERSYKSISVFYENGSMIDIEKIKEYCKERGERMNLVPFDESPVLH